MCFLSFELMKQARGKSMGLKEGRRKRQSQCYSGARQQTMWRCQRIGPQTAQERVGQPQKPWDVAGAGNESDNWSSSYLLYGTGALEGSGGAR